MKNFKFYFYYIFGYLPLLLIYLICYPICLLSDKVTDLANNLDEYLIKIRIKNDTFENLQALVKAKQNDKHNK